MKSLRLFSWLAIVILSTGLISACDSTRTQESPGEYIDSSVITTKVKTALVDDSQVSALEIEVDTFKDRVILSGFVDSEAERVKAEQIAWSVDGVGQVENNLVVK